MLPGDYKLSKRVCRDKTLGYEYFIDSTHPLANKQGKVYLHRHLGSVKVGRWLSDEHVHHIDGNRANNALENLAVMPQSEHASLHRPAKRQVEAACALCGRTVYTAKPWAKFCSSTCSVKAQTKFCPGREELEQAVSELPTTHVARLYGVSDQAVAKRCKKLGIVKPGRGHWQKVRRAR